MDYIVSAEDTPYYHWQLELLIESFKMHGLQDRLLIALAASPASRTPDFTRNLSKHGRTVSHENVGRKRGYAYLNKPYAVSTAVKQGQIKQPFTVIEPDMMMFSPMSVEKEPMAFQVKPFFNLEFVKENIPNIKEYVKTVTGNADHWFPIGSVYTFNNMPEEFFDRIVSWSEFLAFETAKTQAEASYWRYLERAGWAMSFLDYFGHLPFKGSYTYEMSLLDYDTGHNFIHYSNGLPPVFSKYLFKFEPPVYLTAALTPFDALLVESPTSVCLYAQRVVRSYLKLDV